MINNEQLNSKHFEMKENGSVLLNDIGRKIFLEEWQRKKHIVVEHPFTGGKSKNDVITICSSSTISEGNKRRITKLSSFYDIG